MKTAWLLGVGLAILVPTTQAAQSAQAYRPLAVSPMCITSETEGAATEAKDPVRMARAMKHAVIAGREAYLAGRMARRLYADPSSPLAGLI